MPDNNHLPVYRFDTFKMENAVIDIVCQIKGHQQNAFVLEKDWMGRVIGGNAPTAKFERNFTIIEADQLHIYYPERLFTEDGISFSASVNKFISGCNQTGTFQENIEDWQAFADKIPTSDLWGEIPPLPETMQQASDGMKRQYDKFVADMEECRHYAANVYIWAPDHGMLRDIQTEKGTPLFPGTRIGTFYCDYLAHISCSSSAENLPDTIFHPGDRIKIADPGGEVEWIAEVKEFIVAGESGGRDAAVTLKAKADMLETLQPEMYRPSKYWDKL